MLRPNGSIRHLHPQLPPGAVVGAVVGAGVVSGAGVEAGAGTVPPLRTVLMVLMMGLAPALHLLRKSSMDRSQTMVPARPLFSTYSH